jgi:hypothetical protein
MQSFEVYQHYYLFTLSPKAIPLYHIIDVKTKQIISTNNPVVNEPPTKTRGLSKNINRYGKTLNLFADYVKKEAVLYLRVYNDVANQMSSGEFSAGVGVTNSYAKIAAFKINELGNISKPVFSNKFSSNDLLGHGEIQISPDGTKLAIANRYYAKNNTRSQILLFSINQNDYSALMPAKQNINPFSKSNLQ